MPFDSEGYCDAYTFREFITNCHMTMGLVGLIMLIMGLLLLIFSSWVLFYILPLNVGEFWDNRHKKNKKYRDFAGNFPFDLSDFNLRLYLMGWLIMVIVLCCLVVLCVGFYWLGHLFVLGQ